MLCLCCSIARARPLLAAADSTSGLLVTAQLVMGCVRFRASVTSLCFFIHRRLSQYLLPKAALLTEMGQTDVLSTIGGHSRPSRGLVAFSVFSPNTAKKPRKPAVLIENIEFRKTIFGEDFSCL